MKKLLILSSLLTLSLFSETYWLNVKKEHYVGKVVEKPVEDDDTEITPPAPPVQDICEVNFENIWTVGAQYGSPALANFTAKLADDSFYDFTILSSTTTNATFNGGSVNGTSYGSAYWQMSRFLDPDLTGAYDYALLKTGTNSGNTTFTRVTFDTAQQIKEISYNDYPAGNRYTTNYTIDFKDCSGNLVHSVTYTSRQSPNSTTPHVVSIPTS